MKQLTIFYQEHCPFCKKAFKYISELQHEHPEYKAIEITKIEETKDPELADKYDYYYVPTFYVDDEKIHEGGIYKPEVEAIFKSLIH